MGRRSTAPADLARARERFLGGTTSDERTLHDSGVRPEIAASWERSLRAGIDASRFEVPYVADLDFQGGLVHCARPVLDHLAEQLTDTSVSVVLTDADGRLLDRRVGEGELRRRLDAISLAPGFSYAEAHAGTNGVGTALQGAAAALVVGAEHFTDRLQPFACAGAPIRHPLTGEVVGVVDVTCLQADANDLMRVLAVTAARDVERLLAERGSRGAREVLEGFRAVCARSSGAVLAVSGETVIVNRCARTLLGAADQERVRRRAAESLRHPAAARQPLELASGPVRLRCTPVGPGDRPTGVVAEVVPTGSTAPTVAAAVSGAPAAPRAARPPARSSARWPERTLTGLVGSSPSWLASCHALRLAAAGRRSTLVRGEVGTGKASAVRAAHLELRPQERLVVVDCAEGADALRVGLADEAVDPAHDRAHDRATVVLRHVERLDDAGAAVVGGLLAGGAPGRWVVGLVTEDGPTRVPDAACGGVPGGVAAAFEDGVHLDPLRHRASDVALLVPVLVDRLTSARRVGCSAEAVRLLGGGLWPGNVTELSDVLRRALAACGGDEITADDVAGFVDGARRRLSPLEAAERDLIVRELVAAAGNRVRAAARLGMSRATLYRRLTAFGITDVGR